MLELCKDFQKPNQTQELANHTGLIDPISEQLTLQAELPNAVFHHTIVPLQNGQPKCKDGLPLVYGVYDSQEEAEAALKQLDPKLYQLDWLHHEQNYWKQFKGGSMSTFNTHIDT